jgi:hypothetical protein
MTKECPKPEARMARWKNPGAFGHLGIESFFRHSDFVIRHLRYIQDLSKATATLPYRAKVRA